MSNEIKKANLAKSQIDDRVGLHSVFMNSQHRENSAGKVIQKQDLRKSCKNSSN